jgi:recombination protein RecT
MSDRTQSAFSQNQGRRDDVATITAQFDHQREKYEGVLGSAVTVEAFRNAFLTAVQKNWNLLEANRQSLWLALQLCANDGLKPDGREAALTIFGDDTEDENGNPVPSTATAKKRVVYMPMIAGLIKLLRNTGDIASIDTPLVYRGEEVELWYEDGQKHFRLVRQFSEDFDDSPENIIGAVAIVTYKDGSWDLEAMSRRQIERVRAVAKAKKGPWMTWYDEQSRKTVLRRLIKRLEKSSFRRIEAVLDADETMTIEGTVEPSRAALPPPDPTSEFTSDEISRSLNRQPVKEPAKTTKQADPKPAETKQPEAKHSRKTTESEKPPADPPLSGFEAWPVNEFGELADGRNDPITDAQEFAAWFAKAWNKTDNREALVENNADALEDLRADVLAAKMVDGVLKQAEKQEPQVEYKSAPLDYLEPPKTPKGSIHWPNYITAAEKILASLPTDAEVRAWDEANRPTYGTDAKGLPIERAVKARLTAIAGDPDEKRAHLFVADIAEIKDRYALRTYDNGAAFQAVMNRWRSTDDKVHLFERVRDAVSRKLQDFGPPQPVENE